MAGKRGFTPTDKEGEGDKKGRMISRVWTNDEEIKIANYLSDFPYLGKDQSKETLKQYYKKMMGKLEFSACDVKQIINKVENMKKKYIKTHNWINQTGVGVRESDPDTFPGKVNAMCAYYYIVDTVWGSCQDINTSYQRDSGVSSTQVQVAQADSQSVPATRHNDDELDILVGDVIAIAGEGVESDHESRTQSDRLQNTQVRNAAKTFESSFKKQKYNRGPTGGPSNKLAEFLKQREDRRATVEEQKLEFEKLKWQQEINSRTQSRSQEIEAEIRKAEIQKEIELKRLEVESQKLKLEMRKLKTKEAE